MFHVGPYGENYKIALMLNIQRDKKLLHNPLVIVPNAPITIDTIVTSMFHSFFNSLAILFTFLQNYSVVRRDSKVDNFTIFFFVDYYEI